MSGTPHHRGGEPLLVAEQVQKGYRTLARPAPGRLNDDHRDLGLDPGAPAIEADGLVKIYGAVRAVDGVSLTVGEGEFFGILGPNGAGKTTLLELIEGCANPTPARSASSANDPGRATPGCCPASACSYRPAPSSTS